MKLTQFRNSYVWLILVAFGALNLGGLAIFCPERLDSWSIRIIGILIFLDGIIYLLKIVSKYIGEEIEN